MKTKNDFISGVTEKYPPELLENRKTVEGNVVGIVFNDPLILDETNLKSSDFITSDGFFYFSLAKQLRKSGYSVFDEVSVLTGISENIRDEFVERGGYEPLQNLVDVIDNRNADVYLDNLYRENIILKLHNNGFNLLIPIQDGGKEVVPYKLFRKMNSESIIDWYDAKLSSFDTPNSSLVTEEEMMDFDEAFIQNCEEGEENGVPFDVCGEDVNGDVINAYPFLSRQINGLLNGTFTMLGGFSSVGKSTWWIAVIAALLYRGRKVMIISNEESIKKFKTKFLVWYLGKRNRYFKLTKKKLTSGDISEEDKKQIEYVRNYWRDKYNKMLKLVSISDANMNVVKKKIREGILKDGIDVVLYDTFKIQENDMTNARQDLALVRDSREFDKIAKKYNIIMLASIQLSEYMRGKLFLDSSVISNAKQVKEQLEGLFLMRPIYDEELDPKSKHYCRPFRLRKVGDKWVEEEYEPDRTAVWRMLFVEKTRTGSNSTDTGVAYLLRYSGDFAIFRETCQCRPRRGKIE